jgi:Ser/Thr protein kinase RdoA (MazF antagonist)
VAARKLPSDVQLLIRPHESKARAALAGLPVQLIHGDCNNGNVLLNGGRVSGFIDFDHLPVGERIYDLAYYLVHVVRRGGRASIREYVDGYDAANPLTPNERAAVPAAMLAAEVSLTSWSYVLLTELPDRARPGEATSYQEGVAVLADAVVADFSVDGGSGHA